MKVALFGRTGFIGSNIADVLQQRDIPFIGISRSKTSPDTIAIDWMNEGALDNMPTDITAAIICSSKLPQKTYEPNDIREFITSNVLGLINILAWAKRRKVSRLIYCSTLSMLPDENKGVELINTQSHYPYKISKAAAEHLLTGYCRENGIDHVVLRIASVYGQGMKPDIINLMIQTAKAGGVFTLDNRNAEADFVHVQDVALAAVKSLQIQPAGAVINVTSGAPIKLKDLWDLVNETVGNPIASIHVRSETPVTSRIYSAEEFKTLIARSPIDLQTGIRNLIKTDR